MTLLRQNFYLRKPEVVAKDLLGKILVREVNGKKLSGIIVETEAYLHENDEAAHSFKGKTQRTSSLFKPGGHAYVHRIHKYFCLDAVCQGEEIAGSVLIRALEPTEGIKDMQKNRGTDNLLSLTSGPGKLGQALEIDKSLDGVDMTQAGSPLNIFDAGNNYSEDEIEVSKRIGITKSAELELRFYLKGSEFVSRKNPNSSPQSPKSF